ncbi:ATP-binding protein [Candidatus Dependentiae bacterium]|nr:ATP-binding protein [Candidatus Dependentiae bacterium]
MNSKSTLLFFGIMGLITTSISSHNIKLGGHDIDIDAIQEGITNAQRAGHDNYRRQLNLINDDISAYENQQIQLAHDLASNRIKQSEYDIRMKQLERRLATRQRDLETLNKQSEKVGDLLTNMIGQGTQLFIETMKDENTRKTQIAVAAARAAAEQDVKNRGQLEIARLLTSPETMQRTGLTIAAAGGALILTYYGTKFAYTYGQRFIGMPKLVRETSDKGLWGSLTNLFQAQEEPTFDKIILPSAIKTAVERTALATKKAKAAGIPQRGVMLYGPPGTGKTMIAKAIAKESGLGYAIMSGADFSQFKEGEDVQQLHMLFDRAEQSKNGYILFFDEADAFLRHRKDLDDRGRKLVDAFLFRTGSKLHKVKILLATNHPNDLDSAVLSRISEQIHVGLPTLEGRIAILQQYISMYYGPTNKQGITIAAELNGAYLEKIATKLDGFSGRDIEDIVGLLQDQLIASQQKMITPATLEAAVDDKIQQRLERNQYNEPNSNS